MEVMAVWGRDYIGLEREAETERVVEETGRIARDPPEHDQDRPVRTVCI